MTTKRTGGCACGAIRYEVGGAPVRMVFCHCRECQMASGSACIAVAVFSKVEFRITKGEPTWYEVERTRGGMNRRGFCATCGSRLFGGGDAEVQGITATSFDDSSWFKPMGHIFAPQAQAWDVMDPALPKFDTYFKKP